MPRSAALVCKLVTLVLLAAAVTPGASAAPDGAGAVIAPTARPLRW